LTKVAAASEDILIQLFDQSMVYEQRGNKNAMARKDVFSRSDAVEHRGFFISSCTKPKGTPLIVLVFNLASRGGNRYMSPHFSVSDVSQLGPEIDGVAGGRTNSRTCLRLPDLKVDQKNRLGRFENGSKGRNAA
jgi:hypothetical protein